jgi:hypothetical protein
MITKFRQTADASGVYREGTAANIARIASSAQCGNLADAAKNGTVIVPSTTIIPSNEDRTTENRVTSSVTR